MKGGDWPGLRRAKRLGPQDQPQGAARAIVSAASEMTSRHRTRSRAIGLLAVQNYEDASDDGENCQDGASALKRQSWDEHHSTGCNQPDAKEQHAPFASP
jgi:hypothetical protein